MATKAKVFALSADGRLIDVAKASRPGSKQLKSDPFSTLYGNLSLVIPPYDFEQLLDLRELCPVHSAAIEQKAKDISGLGWSLVQKADVEKPNEAQYDKIMAFLDDPNPEATLTELLDLLCIDIETLGWGMFEIPMNGDGTPSQLIHMPAHTMRVHQDGKRYVQVRAPGDSASEESITISKQVWFKTFGLTDDNGQPLYFNSSNGESLKAEAEDSKQANQILVFRQMSSRSSFYGIPGYVSSMGAICALRAVQDFNLSFFDNWGIPANLIVVSGGSLPDDLEVVLSKTLKESYKRKETGAFQSFKTLVLPLPYPDVKCEVMQLSSPTEAGFSEYTESLQLQVLIAHRVPPYRIGWPITGGLGGNTAHESLGVYKDAVVERGQTVLEHRFNRFLRAVFGTKENDKYTLDWLFKLNDIDLSDREADQKYWTVNVSFGFATPNEGRVALGIGDAEDNPDGDKFLVSSNLVPLDQAGQVVPAIKSEDETVAAALHDFESRLNNRLQALDKGGVWPLKKR
jgi:PBSX family phage portal protein